MEYAQADVERIVARFRAESDSEESNVMGLDKYCEIQIDKAVAKWGSEHIVPSKGGTGDDACVAIDIDDVGAVLRELPAKSKKFATWLPDEASLGSAVESSGVTDFDSKGARVLLPESLKRLLGAFRREKHSEGSAVEDAIKETQELLDAQHANLAQKPASDRIDETTDYRKLYEQRTSGVLLGAAAAKEAPPRVAESKQQDALESPAAIESEDATIETVKISDEDGNDGVWFVSNDLDTAKAESKEEEIALPKMKRDERKDMPTPPRTPLPVQKEERAASASPDMLRIEVDTLKEARKRLRADLDDLQIANTKLEKKYEMETKEVEKGKSTIRELRKKVASLNQRLKDAESACATPKKIWKVP